MVLASSTDFLSDADIEARNLVDRCTEPEKSRQPAFREELRRRALYVDPTDTGSTLLRRA